jgi:hypothetical protein
MKELIRVKPKLIDVDWNLNLVTDESTKSNSNDLTISLKLKFEDLDKKIIVKYLDMNATTFFKLYKNTTDIKNYLEMIS